MFEPEKENQKDKKKKKKKLGGKLHIKLKEARNLPAKDSSGFSDPFVKRYGLRSLVLLFQTPFTLSIIGLSKVCHALLSYDYFRNQLLRFSVTWSTTGLKTAQLSETAVVLLRGDPDPNYPVSRDHEK